MELVTPGIGLIFWTSLTFLILVFLLAKFAWKPILEAVETRNKQIEDAMFEAERTKEEMEKIQADNQNLLKEARNQRDEMLKEAKEMKNNIVSEAKDKAKDEADKLIASAKETIKNEKMAAMTDIKNQVAVLSVDIAEKILKDQLASDDKQKKLVNNLLEEVNVN